MGRTHQRTIHFQIAATRAGPRRDDDDDDQPFDEASSLSGPRLAASNVADAALVPCATPWSSAS